MTSNNKFQEFTNTDRIWAIGSLHSSINSFQSIKKYILSNFKKDDKLIFLGNLIGYNNQSKQIITDVLSLRFSLMAKFGLNHEDIVFLRGAQEEMFSKLLQLQIAPNPSEIINWIFNHGVDETVKSYNFKPDQFIETSKNYDYQIKRDTFGVPHVYGNRDKDAAFGFGFAQTEDDYENIEFAVKMARGTMSDFDFSIKSRSNCSSS